ncbi:MAG: HypC/HybG/HupF family hydrogenase formation chaperone [Candidatus Aenigmarchaeota archaeon]|nr:HypC/HybG/HupF family hydrogenase formation chaperone [Candidatus Aenigmarchaeota archaeon]NIP40125.1 HypC/HybG/HupF family hydrogenase formation chaperone [Candidatus Aenigmarchaeota archaeon]NIQ18202.1 HypC/HybG/HupF family hydrogenase formation chaperone [Candidatus Aenigmarchaeota archaeon]NIS72959.1 HypC/HybG/HupF family hydrogenase formation chaperone [Candidatus Aenigmarchaeota archaeon]
MCIALKGKVLDAKGKEALVDFGGVRRKVNSEFFKVRKGEKVLVFNDFVIERLQEGSKPAGGFDMERL